MTVVPSENTGSTREELICPHCFSSLERHPVYADEFSGRTALEKGTRCKDQKPGEECPYASRVPPEVMKKVIKTQYKSPSLIAKIRSRITAKNTAATVVIIILLLVFLGNPFSSIGQPSAKELTISATTPVGDYTEGIRIVDYNTGRELFNERNITYRDIGTKEVSIIPEDKKLAAKYARIDFNNQKVLESSGGVNITNGTLQLEVERRLKVSRSGAISSGFVRMNFLNPDNIDGNINVTLKPPEGNQIQNSRLIEKGDRQINIPGSVVSQTASIQAVPIRDEIIQNKRYFNGTQEIPLEGTVTPDNVSFSIRGNNRNAGIEKSLTKRIEGQDSITAIVESESTQGPANLVLFGKMKGQKQFIQGETNGRANENITIGDGPATANVTIEGERTERQVTKNGTIKGDSFNIEIEGDETVESRINFTGAEIQDSQVATSSLSARNNTKEKTVTNISENGTYRIVLNKNGNTGFTSGYYINNQKYESGRTLELKKGDSVRIWADAKSEIEPEDNNEQNNEQETENNFQPPPDYPLVVENTRVSSNTLQDGGNIRVQATITNPSQTFYTSRIILFKNGNRAQTKSLNFPPGQSKDVQFSQVKISKEGTNSLSINNGNTVEVTNGVVNNNPEPQENTPSGQINVQLTKLTQQPKIKISTKPDGQFQCITSPENGSCKLDNMTPGTNTLDIIKEGISQAQYTIKYNTTVGQTNPRLKIGDRTVIEKRGIIQDQETLKRTIHLKEGTYPIYTSTRNNKKLKYSIEWAKSSQVDRPIVDKNNTRVILSNKTKPLHRYSISNMKQGENTLQIRDSSGNTFYAKLSWIESGSSVIPRLVANGRIACSKEDLKSQNCVINNINDDTLEIRLEQGKTPLNYQIRYIKTDVPREVELTINNNKTTINGNNNPSWRRLVQLSDLSLGANNIRLRTIPENTQATAQLKYQQLLQRPVQPIVLQFRSPENNEEIQIPADKINVNTGEMTEPMNITIPEGWVARGNDNLLEFSNKNQQGGVVIKVETNISRSGQIVFEERG